MSRGLERLRQRKLNPWLVGRDSPTFLSLTEALAQEFTAVNRARGLSSILIADPDPIRFLAGFLAAQATTPRVFLGNPQWGMAEWQQALAIARPDRMWGNGFPMDVPAESRSFSGDEALADRCGNPSQDPLPPADSSNGLILIPSGGSSGRVQFVMHRWHTLAAAVEGFQQHFQVTTVNSLCVLPLHHVSGLMQGMRSLLTGGKLWLTDFKTLKASMNLLTDPSGWVLSLVPTQLQALLDNPALAQWLAQFQTVFLGGAPTWPDLLGRARAHQIPLAPCYGMTETAAQIAALKPAEFLAGNPSVGKILPHAQVALMDTQGQPVARGLPGQIQIRADSLALGYYPDGRFHHASGCQPVKPGLFLTDDVGYLDDQGYLTLVGRLSDKIITGGENVFPAEVEAAIRATHLVTDVAVLGMPDPYWGQRVTAVYVPRQVTLVASDLAVALQNRIARFKHPKRWVSVAALPRNAQGKLNRKTLEGIVTRWQQTQDV
jgi:O-succinylbenzoic acid--CoA ligase